MRIAVISDIHCHSHTSIKGEKVEKGGYYYPLMPDKPVKQNPFSALTKFIRENNIEVDYLVSPGDYSHKIDPKGLKSSWDQLKLLKHEFKAKYLIGTIGNHDVESRVNSKGPFQLIKKFDLDFPIYNVPNASQLQSELLTNGFFSFEDEDVFFLVVNSSFDHWDTEEAKHGKVELDSLDELNSLVEATEKKIKIVLIHHNPIVHETGVGDTDDLIHGSEDFLKNILGVNLLIHGHKHDYRFSQHPVKSKVINILSAGSFSCYLSGMRVGVSNHFHIVDFNDMNEECGLIESYSYNQYDGWKTEKEFTEGFGNNDSRATLSIQIEKICKGSTDPYITWDEILESKPSLNFISATIRNAILEELSDKGSLKRVSFDSYTKFPKEIIIR